MRSGLSQEQLAERMSWSTETVSNLERGKTIPTLRSLLSLSDVLEFDLSQVLNQVALRREIAPERALQEAQLLDLLRSADDQKLQLLLELAKAVERAE